MKKFIFPFVAIAALALGFSAQYVFAQTKTVPMITITSVSDPLASPNGASPITLMYKVANPSAVPLSNVTVSDDLCSGISGHLGDTNSNNLLNTNEVWIYTCTTNLTQTATDTATVTAYVNDLKVVAVATAKISATYVPGLPDNGPNPNTLNITLMVWIILGVILVTLIIFFMVTRKKQ